MPSLFGAFLGIHVIGRPYPRVEIPRHRKKRLAKKWRKRYGPLYRELPVNDREILHDPQRHILYCYPPMEAEITRILREQ
jgi:hypothetical protein